MENINFDIAHVFSGLLILISFIMLYQDRLYALINIFIAHSIVLALFVSWQAYVQDAPHLYITAFIAFFFKAIIIPLSLHKIIVRLNIHREIEAVVSTSISMIIGIGLVILSMSVMTKVYFGNNIFIKEDMAFSLAIILIGLFMMVSRRNAVSQIIGFMSLENGLILSAAGANGMPLVVEISVALSTLIAFIIIGIFLFRIRHSFDTVDTSALDILKLSTNPDINKTKENTFSANNRFRGEGRNI